MKIRLLIIGLLFSVLNGAAQDTSMLVRLYPAGEFFLGPKLGWQGRTKAQTLEAGMSFMYVLEPGGPCGIPFVVTAATASAEMRWSRTSAETSTMVVSPKLSVEGNMAFLVMRAGAVYDMRPSARGMRYDWGIGLSSLGFMNFMYGVEFPRTGEPAKLHQHIEINVNIPLGLWQ